MNLKQPMPLRLPLCRWRAALQVRKQRQTLLQVCCVGDCHRVALNTLFWHTPLFFSSALTEALRQALKAKQALASSIPASSTPATGHLSQAAIAPAAAEPQQSATQIKKAAAAAAAAAAAEPAKPKINWNSKPKPECVAAFKSLLTDIGIVGTDTFDAVLSRMTADDRFSALKSRAERESKP
jgi:hypothetical protein